jgi:hypothetical protein
MRLDSTLVPAPKTRRNAKPEIGYQIVEAE